MAEVEPPRGAGLCLAPEEQLYKINQLCRGFGPRIMARQDPGDSLLWRVITPAYRHDGAPQGIDLAVIAIPADFELIEGCGAEPAAAIENCWARITSAPIMLWIKGHAPRWFRWDGTRFCDT